jgi:mRNA interferase MazF
VSISLPGTHGKPRPALVIQSEVMVDKAHTVAREKVGSRIGQPEDEAMMAVDRALATFLGFA